MEELRNRMHLAATPGDHSFPSFGVEARKAAVVVFQTGGPVFTVRPTRDGPNTRSGLGPLVIPAEPLLRLPVFLEELLIEDIDLAEIGWDEGLGPVRQRLARKHDHRNVETMGDVYCVDGLEQAVFDIVRRKDDLGCLAMGSVDGEVEVPLAVFGWHTSARPATLYIHDHHRYLGHGCESDHLTHQGKAWAGGGGHALYATKGGADTHAQRGDLVLRLNDAPIEARQIPGEPLEDLACRGYGIAGEEPDTGEERSVRDGLVAGHHQQVGFIAECEPVLVGFGDVLLRVGNARVEGP